MNFPIESVSLKFFNLDNKTILLFLSNCSLKNAKKVFNRIKSELDKIDSNCKFSPIFFEIKLLKILQEEKFFLNFCQLKLLLH